MNPQLGHWPIGTQDMLIPSICRAHGGCGKQFAHCLSTLCACPSACIAGSAASYKNMVVQASSFLNLRLVKLEALSNQTMSKYDPACWRPETPS